MERYRKRITEEKRGKIAGRVAIVTGGAQGVGRGIAEGLLKEGAHVVIADINYETAEKVARKFEESFGEGRAVPYQVDVTREDEVQDMVAFTVKRFGGIDILISNAGILIADNILSFPYDKFRKVIEVNFYGYFLCAQKVARVMVKQGYGDIIQINSKSGKKGSKANSAYASSKFAGIGFTQSIAMDLAAHNIFVNAICPGNFLDLELWQREGGLLDQYLKAGKVPGAKTRKDVENYYKNLTLLKRASTIEDVMHTIFYILKQRGETGQAYNVSQGQEMR
ncbi:MAG: SDR family NAD(P)-dependent oxidoreductase [Caldiserica bacterium]|nr:SDR family NAD(P)-dependent oxidoreductase [Caldisericota bacterium]